MIRKFWIVTISVLFLLGCGSDSPTKTQGGGDGRIYVHNLHESPITVTYVNRETGVPVETDIPVGEKKEVSGGVIDGGKKVTVNVKGPVNRTISPNQTSALDIEVQIDGDVTIMVTDIRSGQVDHTIQ